MPVTKRDELIILDFGSQYTQLIARRIREAGVYCEILPYSADPADVIGRDPKGLILSGGPSSVYDTDAPKLPQDYTQTLSCPILGICYGLQLLALQYGGEVSPSVRREYGYSRLVITDPESPLFRSIPHEIDVWMSHGDCLTRIPSGYRATSRAQELAGSFEDESRRIFGVQFHPEVAHTPLGARILNNFAVNICGAKADWSPVAIINEQVEAIRAKVRDRRVVCGLSGGIDSAVAAVLVNEAIGEQQTCIFVDTGLLREGEFETTVTLFRKNLNLCLRAVDASERFVSALAGVLDPEQKRRIIGRIFIEIFEAEALSIGEVDFLVQGTLYPDVIESVSVRGPSAVIKSHHNVGGLPRNMQLRLIEPLRELFKDEVREIGRELRVPPEILSRHPFPGPGLAVRVVGEVSQRALEIVRSADRIVEEELRLGSLYDSLWQAFPVLLPIFSVGVMGDYRTYEQVIAIRAVNSVDGMTADWARLPHDVMARISSRIIAEIKGINRVVYDISSKPPSTIEWE